MTISEFLTQSVENGNKSRSRVTSAKIDIKDKSKDALRSPKQSIKVFNPLNTFLESVIISAHKEITDNKRHLLLLSELLLQVSNVETLTALTVTLNKAVKRLRFMFPVDAITEADIASALALAIDNYRVFTKDVSDKAIKVKIEADVDFKAKLEAVSFARFAETKAKAVKVAEAEANAIALAEAQAVIESAKQKAIEAEAMAEAEVLTLGASG